MTLRFIFLLITIVAVSLALGRHSPVTGFVVFANGLLWAYAARINFKLSILPVTLLIWAGVSMSAGLYAGTIAMYPPSGGGNWLFSPITGGILAAVLIGLSAGFWLSLSAIAIWTIGRYQRRTTASLPPSTE